MNTEWKAKSRAKSDREQDKVPENRKVRAITEQEI